MGSFPVNICASCGQRKDFDRWADSTCSACARKRGSADWGLVGVVALAMAFVAVISVGMVRACNAADAEEPSVADMILGAARDAAAWAKHAAGVPDWIEGPAPGGWIPGLWCDSPLADGSRDCAQANLAEHGVTALVPDGWYCDDLGGGTACGPAPGGWRCGPAPGGWRCVEGGP